MTTLAPSFLIGSSSYLQVTRTSITSRTSSKVGQIRPRSAELAALECLEKSPKTYNGRNLVNTLAPSFLNQSSSFLQVTRTCMKARMSSNFGQIPTPTPELSALARLKGPFIFDRIFFILAGNEDTHNISDEFEIRPDRTKDCGVSCP